MPPTPSVTISSPAGSLIILPVSARTPHMRRFQVFVRHGGAGAAAQARAEFLLDLLPWDFAAQQGARQLYAGRLGGIDGFPPDLVEARLRADLRDGVFIAGYYVPSPGSVPMMPAAAVDTSGLAGDPPGTPNTWSVPQRIAAMLRRIPKNMPDALRAQVTALLSPESIAALAIFFAVLAVAQLAGAGEVADAILAALAWRLAGLAGFYALGKFVGEIIVAARATTLPVIETAAKNAAGDLVTLGVQFLSAVVLRAVAQRKMPTAKAEPEPEPETPPPNTKKPSTIKQNAAQGKAFEQKGLDYLKTKESNVRPQVSIRPYNKDGTLANYRVRVDAIGTDQNGDIALTDFKSSETAGFTQNQKDGYPLIENYGGEVVGDNGGSFYPAGTQIPPTPVSVLKPSNIP